MSMLRESEYLPGYLGRREVQNLRLAERATTPSGVWQTASTRWGTATSSEPGGHEESHEKAELVLKVLLGPRLV